MLAACAARLRGQQGMVWVDLGGGTGENVDLMASYIDLPAFKQIYVVDLCKSLCEQVCVREYCFVLHLLCRVVWRCCGGHSIKHAARGFKQPEVLASGASTVACQPDSLLPSACLSIHLQARKKVAEKGWKNVTVVEADACHFVPPEGTATLATFSYSLSSEWQCSERALGAGRGCC